MDDQQYVNTQATLMGLVRVVNDLDLGGFIERIDQAESMGALLDPTLYRKAGGNLAVLKRLATGAKKFQEAVRKEQENAHPLTA